MSWLGAGVGAGIGLVVGGPIGALVGAWVGSYFGNGKTVATAHSGNRSQEQQTLFFVALNAMLAKMAKADGVVSKREIDAISAIYQKIGLDAEDRKAAIDIFNRSKDNATSIYEYADQYAQVATQEMREMIYAILWEVALADGQIADTEDAILRRIVDHLRISRAMYHQYHEQVYGHSGSHSNGSSNQGNQSTNQGGSIQHHYALLDASPSDSDDEIKRKYRRKIAEFHPDKIQAKGLPEAFMAFANEQSAKINEAYAAIQKSRGR